ncbi:MAG: hypothetical protein K0S55_1453 [Clostridia bacterium]|jgi:hypothetical protein|nr:hypothetical protein [Clostridia bacterium]
MAAVMRIDKNKNINKNINININKRIFVSEVILIL